MTLLRRFGIYSIIGTMCLLLLALASFWLASRKTMTD